MTVIAVVPSGRDRMYSFWSVVNSGRSLPGLKDRVFSAVLFMVVKSPSMSAPKLQVYITRISSPSTKPNSANPLSVNQSFSVPIQPEPAPPSNSPRDLPSLSLVILEI